MSDFKPSGTVHGETDHVQSTDVRRSVDVPEGVWTDVRVGQVTAEGTVTRAEYPGVLFDAEDPTKVIVWHPKPEVFACGRRNIQPEQVVFEEESGAPWCPSCLKKKRQIIRKSKVKGRRKKVQMLDRLKAQTMAKALPIKGLKESLGSSLSSNQSTKETEDSEVVWREQDAGG